MWKKDRNVSEYVCVRKCLWSKLSALCGFGFVRLLLVGIHCMNSVTLSACFAQSSQASLGSGLAWGDKWHDAHRVLISGRRSWG